MVTGVNGNVSTTMPMCEPCVLGKMTRQPFSGTRPVTTRLLERIHSDVCGAPSLEDLEGNKYFVTFIDDYTRVVMVFLIRAKSEVFEKFKIYQSRVETHFNNKIERLRCDGGGEYCSNVFKQYLKERGVVVEYTAAYNPEQTGVAERMNRTIMDRVRSMMAEANADDKLWGEAVMAATYLVNRSPTVALNSKTPFEMYFGRKPDVGNLRVWGCRAYVHVPKQRRKKKIANVAVPGMMVGYEINGYRILTPMTMWWWCQDT